MTNLDGVVHSDLSSTPQTHAGGSSPPGRVTTTCCGGAPPVRNVAHVYTATDAGGGPSGVEYSLRAPYSDGVDVYGVSFTATFDPQGTPTDPVTFACDLQANDSAQRVVSSSVTVSDAGFAAGVNGYAAVVRPDEGLLVWCGPDKPVDWTWGDRPLEVTLVRLDRQRQPRDPAPEGLGGRPKRSTAVVGRNIAYSYAFDSSGGQEGMAEFALRPLPEPGIYAAYFTASFSRESFRSPMQFVCWLQKAGVMRAESSTYNLDGAYAIGVDGATVLKLGAGDGSDVSVWCGAPLADRWSFSPGPLLLTLVRLDGLHVGSLGGR